MAYIGRTPTGSILTSADIADGSISTDKLADSAVSTAKVADDAIENTKLNLASDYAFTGTVSGGGKVLQVVGNSITSNQAGNTSSEVMISNYVANITPSATSSKILILFTGLCEIADSNSAGQNCAFKLRINTGSSASLSSTDYQQVRFGAYNYNSAGGYIEEHGNLVFSYLHSPSTTSAVHVGISVANYDGHPSWRLGIADFKSHFTLIEVQG